MSLPASPHYCKIYLYFQDKTSEKNLYQISLLLEKSKIVGNLISVTIMWNSVGAMCSNVVSLSVNHPILFITQIGFYPIVSISRWSCEFKIEGDLEDT